VDILLNIPAMRRHKRVLSKVWTLVKTHKQAKARILILQLNRLLRGWAQYHRHVVSKEAFAAVDAAVFHSVWHWAKRRHPHKNARWVRQRYFRSHEHRQWVFSGTVVGRRGLPA